MAVIAPLAPAESIAARGESMWVRVRGGVPGASRTEGQDLRRWQGRELLVVLLVFPAMSSLSAVIGLIAGLKAGHPTFTFFPDGMHSPWMVAALTAAVLAFSLPRHGSVHHTAV